MELSIKESISEKRLSHQYCVCLKARQFKYLDEYHSKGEWFWMGGKTPPPAGSLFTALAVTDFPAYGVIPFHEGKNLYIIDCDGMGEAE